MLHRQFEPQCEVEQRDMDRVAGQIFDSSGWLTPREKGPQGRQRLCSFEWPAQVRVLDSRTWRDELMRNLCWCLCLCLRLYKSP